MKLKLKLINWNIGGAKYFELKSSSLAEENSRERFRELVNEALHELIRRYGPDVITLQEIVEFEANGDAARAQCILNKHEGYDYFPNILIDTLRHSHQGKWNKVRTQGEWTNPNAYFAQGNAFLVSKHLKRFPLFSLPKANLSFAQWRELGGMVTVVEVEKSYIEDVILETGVYFGSRDTEPRGASVLHLVFDKHVGPDNEAAPQDVFVINAHLTTLTLEREGVPAVDREASEKRLQQLSIIFDGIISRYNSWARQGYIVRGNPERPASDTIHRRPPIWIVAGDFNFTPQSEEYAHVKHRNFLDLIKHHGLGTKATGLGSDPTLTVDYVFAGPLFWPVDPHEMEKQLNFNTIQIDNTTRVSDHFPIVVTMPLEF
jgi:endonuclease/exonuclease/phosphatase family metal-dependent hydrolase